MTGPVAETVRSRAVVAHTTRVVPPPVKRTEWAGAATASSPAYVLPPSIRAATAWATAAYFGALAVTETGFAVVGVTGCRSIPKFCSVEVGSLPSLTRSYQ